MKRTSIGRVPPPVLRLRETLRRSPAVARYGSASHAGDPCVVAPSSSPPPGSPHLSCLSRASQPTPAKRRPFFAHLPVTGPLPKRQPVGIFYPRRTNPAECSSAPKKRKRVVSGIVFRPLVSLSLLSCPLFPCLTLHLSPLTWPSSVSACAFRRLWPAPQVPDVSDRRANQAERLRPRSGSPTPHPLPTPRASCHSP